MRPSNCKKDTHLPDRLWLPKPRRVSGGKRSLLFHKELLGGPKKSEIFA